MLDFLLPTARISITWLDYMAPDENNEDQPRTKPRGPRGGRTTISGDGLLIRKTFFIDRDVEEHLRNDAHAKRTTEAAIVRQLLRDHYGIE